MNYEPLQETPTAENFEKKVGRWPYFFTKASQKSKITAIVALGLGVLCILSLALSANLFVNGSIFKLPAFKMIIALSGDENMAEEFEELEKEADALVKELDDILEDEELIEEYEKKHNISFDEMEDEHGITLKEYRKILKTPSLSAITKGMTQITKGNNDSVQVIRILIGIVIGFTVFLILLTALAVFLQKTALCVMSCVLSLGFTLLTGGIPWAILCAVGAIGAAVLFSGMKKEYRRYKKGEVLPA